MPQQVPCALYAVSHTRFEHMYVKIIWGGVAVEESLQRKEIIPVNTTISSKREVVTDEGARCPEQSCVGM